jgi:hypothetical protein
MAQINDLMFDTLRTLGYTGALPDMRYAYERDFGIRLSREVLTVTGLKSVTDAKMAYWSDASNWGLTAVENLFANDEEGTFLDFTTSQVYADTAGTTPAAVGTGIALTLDKSQGGELGAELVTNGTFDADLSGWTFGQDPSSWTWDAGRAFCDNATLSTDTFYTQVFPPLTFVEIVIDVEVVSGGLFVRDSASLLAQNITETGIYTYIYFNTNVSLTREILFSRLFSAGEFTGYLNSVSVKELKGVHALQSTSTARPIFGRVPVGGRRNLIPDGSDSAYINSRSALSSPIKTTGAALNPFGTATDAIQYEVAAGQTGFNLRFFGSSSVVSVDTSRSVFIKPLAGAGGKLQLVAAGRVTGELDLATNATSIASISGFIGLESVVDALSDGWLRFKHSFTGGGDLEVRLIILGASEGDQYLVWGAQEESASAGTAYQSVVTQHDITEAGVPSVYKAFFDKSDDILPVTLPTITGGTVALVGTSGIWIEDDWDFTTGTLNIGPTTIAGLPAGILSVVGDLCAVIINDRAWTAAERAGVIAWGKARGAPGVFGLGEELVTNGTFDTDVSGWTGVRSAILSSVSGELNVEGGGTTFPSAVQDISGALVEGVSYNVTCVLTADSASAARIFIGNSIASTPYSTIVEVPVSTTASVEFSFAASSDAASLGHIIVGHKGATVGEISTFDNVSMRAFELLP